MTKGKTSRKKQPKGTQDLDGMTGPGVGATRIKAVDLAASRYFYEKELRCQQTPKEVEAKKKLMAVLKEHEKEIGRDPDGVLIYRYDEKDLIVKLEPGEDHLSVKKIKKEPLDD